MQAMQPFSVHNLFYSTSEQLIAFALSNERLAKDKKDEQQSFVCMWVSDLVQLSGQVFLVGPFVAFFSFICMHAQEAKVQNRSQIAADSFLANKLWIGQVVNGT